jgi:hypothetical protein
VFWARQPRGPSRAGPRVRRGGNARTRRPCLTLPRLLLLSRSRGYHGQPAAASPARAPARAAAAAGAHLVTFVNRVSQTVWVGAAQNPAHPLARTGWKLLPGHSLTITVPKHWNGRFWGRTGCLFRAGRGHCQSGDCGGRYQCTGNGAIPATLAEYDMNAWDGLDFYDVSMVDGSNLSE